MPDLTITQKALLDAVSKAKQAKAGARARIELENRERLERGLREVDDRLNRAVREAFEGGVSKRKIGQLGLGTSDPTIVNRTLAKTANEAAIEEAVARISRPVPIRDLSEAQVVERGLFVPEGADIFVEVHYENFPTQWTGDEYPNPLVGVLARVDGVWAVLEDPSELFLQWELDEWNPNGGVLPRLLNTYAAQAAA